MRDRIVIRRRPRGTTKKLPPAECEVDTGHNADVVLVLVLLRPDVLESGHEPAQVNCAKRDRLVDLNIQTAAQDVCKSRLGRDRAQRNSHTVWDSEYPG